MKLYLIRHGETALNAGGYLQGWGDEPLNDAGRDLAVLTGRGMRGIRFDGGWSSPLKRARETADIVLRECGCEGVPVREDPRLKEIFLGEDEGCRLGEGTSSYEEELRYFTDPRGFRGFAKGETIWQVCERTQAFLEDLIAGEDDGTYLIATHACPFRALQDYVYGHSGDFWRGHLPYNCEVSVLEVENGQIRIPEEGRIYYDKDLIVDNYLQKGKQK